jgi:hypothetical protein
MDDDVRHYPGKNIPPMLWDVVRPAGGSGGRHFRQIDRLQTVHNPDPRPELAAVHNPSLGSPTKKTVRYSAFGALARKRPKLHEPWHANRALRVDNTSGADVQSQESEHEEEDDAPGHEPSNQQSSTGQHMQVAAAATTSLDMDVKAQIRALVTLYEGPLCLRIERSPPTFVMQNVKMVSSS